jgi:hypothetical protein
MVNGYDLSDEDSDLEREARDVLRGKSDVGSGCPNEQRARMRRALVFAESWETAEIVEGGEEFGEGKASSAEFAYDDACGGVGEDGCIGE